MNKRENPIKMEHFANYSRRIQAVIIDSMILLVLLVAFIILISEVELSYWIKLSLITFVGVLFEPVWVSITGASLGHHYKGLRVEKHGSGRNLNLLEALFRFLVKAGLGVISLVFFLTTKRHQALHDMAVNSVVVMNEAAIKKGYKGVSSRAMEVVGYKSASKIRRALIISVYTVALFILMSALTLIFISEDCVFDNKCSSLEGVIGNIFDWVMIGVFFLIVYFGWHGKLLGCRRSKVKAI